MAESAREHDAFIDEASAHVRCGAAADQRALEGFSNRYSRTFAKNAL